MRGKKNSTGCQIPGMLENGPKQQIKLIKHLELVEGLFIRATLHVASFVDSKYWDSKMIDPTTNKIVTLSTQSLQGFK